MDKQVEDFLNTRNGFEEYSLYTFKLKSRSGESTKEVLANSPAKAWLLIVEEANRMSPAIHSIEMV